MDNIIVEDKTINVTVFIIRNIILYWLVFYSILILIETFNKKFIANRRADKISIGTSIVDADKKVDHLDIKISINTVNANEKVDNSSLNINTIDRNKKADNIVLNIIQKNRQARYKNKIKIKNNKW